MRLYAPTAIFTRYDAALRELALHSTDDYFPCANVGCNSGSFGEVGGAVEFVTCADCGSDTCITCNTLWHPDTSHEENRRAIREADRERRRGNRAVDDQERDTERMLERETKLCPRRGCGVRIMRNGGCDHMTCTFSPSHSLPVLSH